MLFRSIAFLVVVTAGFALDSVSYTTNNKRMVIPGRVHNGVVVLEAESALPEGAVVMVTFLAPSGAKPPRIKRRVQLPLIPTDQPGSVHLTNERIAQILDEEDASPRR